MLNFSSKVTTVIFWSATFTVADCVFKYLALSFLSPVELLPQKFVQLGLYKNTGVAFNIPISLWVLLPITIILLGIFFYLFKKSSYQMWPLIPLWFGAFGNFLDRLVNGFTTDYIFIQTGAVLNIADFLIFFGIFALLFHRGGLTFSKKHV